MGPSLLVFMVVFLAQVQSIDYSGDEVQVTMTDGTGCTAQKVGASISRGVARGLGVGKTVFSTRKLAFGSLPGALFDS